MKLSFSSAVAIAVMTAVNKNDERFLLLVKWSPANNQTNRTNPTRRGCCRSGRHHSLGWSWPWEGTRPRPRPWEAKSGSPSRKLMAASMFPPLWRRAPPACSALNPISTILAMSRSWSMRVSLSGRLRDWEILHFISYYLSINPVFRRNVKLASLYSKIAWPSAFAEKTQLPALSCLQRTPSPFLPPLPGEPRQSSPSSAAQTLRPPFSLSLSGRTSATSSTLYRPQKRSEHKLG